MNNVEQVTDVIKTYFGNWFFLIFLLIALTVFFIKGNKRIKIYTGVSIILLFLIYNDIFYGFCKNLGMGSEYYRFLWILPVIPLGAVFLAKCRERISYKILQVAFLVFIFGMAFVSSGTYLTREEISMPENKYGVPNSILELVQAINECKEVEEPIVLCDEHVALRIRQIDPSIKLALNRSSYLNFGRGNKVSKQAKQALKLTTEGKIKKVKRFQRFAAKRNINYIVLANSIVDEQFMKELNCIPVTVTGNYTIFLVTLDYQ